MDQETVYLGLAVTSHDTNNLERAFFNNFQINVIEVGISTARTIPEPEIVKGGSISGIEVTAIIEEGKSADVVIEEIPPAGFVVSNVSANAGDTTVESDGSITWTITGASGSDSKLTYDVQDDSAPMGASNFSGSIASGDNEFATTGDAAVSVVPPIAGDDLGIFDDHESLGDNIQIEGNVRYDPGSETFFVIGNGADIWGSSDNFHYLYTTVSGDFIITIEDASVYAGGPNPTTSDWHKMGIMVRENYDPEAGPWLDPGSNYAFAMLRNQDQGLILQWRETYGGGAAPGFVEGDQVLPADHNSTFGLMREGDTFTDFYYDENGEIVRHASHDVVFETDPVYVGIAVTSHQTGSTAIGQFRNPQLYLGTPVRKWMLY